MASSTSQIKVLEACLVTPPSESPDSAVEVSLPLTFFDLLWLKFDPVERIFYYELTDVTPTVFNTEILPKLKHSLSLTLLRFLPLAGYLTWPSHAAKPIILYTPKDGVSLTVAESDNSAHFDDLSSNEMHDAFLSHPCVPKLSTSDVKASIIALQITLFPNKGFSIGCTTHHAVLDGKSSILFMKAWAHICKHNSSCLVKARGLKSDDTIMFGIAADCRARLDPPIPTNYFGNCVFLHVAVLAGSAMQDDGIVFVAQKVSEVIKRIEKAALEGAKEKVKKVMAIEPAVIPVGVAGSARFEVYGVDFGWGRPKNVEVTSIDRTGAISMAESKGESGGVEIGLVLKKEVMEIFENLFVSGLKHV
ncbi:hypothetical protein D5086_003816 [Populus alba]|uniref:Uncharacterized protein n=1 Tax=Populus alba TaxID=43335 RepID=A0ACC4D5D6_POPAL